MPSRTPPPPPKSVPLPPPPSEKPTTSVAVMSNSLRPPPRPRSVSHLALSKPPSESLPPVPVLLHSNDNLHTSSTPTSPISPTTPPYFASFSQYRYGNSSPTLLPSNNNSIRSSSVGPVQGTVKSNKPLPPRKMSNPISSSGHAIRVPKEGNRGRLLSVSSVSSVGTYLDRGRERDREDLVDNRAEKQGSKGKINTPRQATDNEDDRKVASTTATHHHSIEDLPPRPVGLVATCYYGIESSMRWREGIDPIQKRFASSNGSWRCQDRFAVFFRPGDQIGPDQVVTKTFWSEAWPYPIETILYGTTGAFNAFSSLAVDPNAHAIEQQRREHERERKRMDHHEGGNESDQQLSSRLKGGLRLTSSSETSLKTAASFPPTARSRDPRYITSEGVQKIAKVTIPMPDVAIDQVDLVKAPIKVELRIFILESPLRVHASAFLLGRTVTGTAELYV
ncbi:hypothetical protein BX616_007203 [Lobosporangium transversale]|uniref:Uncharacterized protein n=1 Tax=Lobosporangium transversale TaxID=64571 RepID=A0A1Y2GGC9_9FUNG|nr:hypothetical protein BCR41DRAFT_358172 [Lobosporangium transversale]KAF9896563.1 hypothetical protein BX616_007203 [Lobosporangium transversale]ORZ10045.1 hypothetical protein BCR41DRAFT_358172 [Lobosporangium transversale]|eukprot:XP_021879135.1 hypothetical protein BCR41DRAFT_358172 [Lobosporangium transversale]